jgi:hypothetical protein
MQRLRPDMQIRVLDAPHLVLQRRPVEVAKVIEEFIVSRGSDNGRSSYEILRECSNWSQIKHL